MQTKAVSVDLESKRRNADIFMLVCSSLFLFQKISLHRWINQVIKWSRLETESVIV